jgi:hypothetical protein
MRRILTMALLAVSIGLGVGIWSARLTSYPNCTQHGCPDLLLRPSFPLWLCCVSGAAAAASVLLAAKVVRPLVSN